MKVNTIICLLLVSFTAQARPIVIITQDETMRGRVQIADPDLSVRTLGKPEIVFDLAASHDTLLDLRIRRATLKLPNGKAATAFAGNQEANLVIVAGGDVAQISIAGVAPVSGASSGAREALVLFRDARGMLIAPAREEVAAFDTDFKPLKLSYTQAAIPHYTPLPVTLLLDHSGSMAGHWKDVIKAADRFMEGLPIFARCRIVLFNDALTDIGPPPHANSCAGAGFSLWKPLPEPSGGTALLAAIENGLLHPPAGSHSGPRLPAVTLVITDGVDTGSSDPAGDLRRLAALKSATGGKLFIFWAGQADPVLLDGIADLQIAAGSDVKGGVERFFRSLSVSLSGLQSLMIEGP